MNSIIQIFQTKDYIAERLLLNIPDSKAIFEYIEYVFINPIENINNLNTLYKTLNEYNINILKHVKNDQGISIIDYYKSREKEIQNDELKLHIINYIKSYNLSTNLLNLLDKKTDSKKTQPTLFELLDRIEKLEKTVEELKIRISNENLLA